MGKYEVTQEDYEAVIGSNPSYFTGDANRPVEQVSWFDATNYCSQRTQRERAAGQIATNCLYRLPTDAEWEYACRGWTSTRFSYGDDPGYTNLTDYAWYGDNSGLTRHPVGQKLPNPWGLHDMHGNVWEWCQDWYGEYGGGIALDPHGPATGSYRVVRGGGWGLPTLAVCGMLSDKDVPGVLAALRGGIDCWFAATTDGPRGLSDAAMTGRGAEAGIEMIPGGTVPEAMRVAAQAARAGDRIVVFGSFHTVGPALSCV